VVCRGVLGRVVLRMSSSGGTWGLASYTLIRVFVAMGMRVMPPLLSQTRLPGTSVHDVWPAALEFDVVGASTSSFSESTT
jgi:hypothetical protein